MNILDSIKHLKWNQVNFADILEGCFDGFFQLNERIKKIQIYRLQTFCLKCQMNTDGWCDNTGDKTIMNVETKQQVIGCGCNLRCKTAQLSHSCPASLWQSID